MSEAVDGVLRKLIPAIEIIDGGCYVCIKRFILEANKGLIDTGWRYVYGYDKDDKECITLEEID